MRGKRSESGAIAIEAVISLTFFMIAVLSIMMISLIVSTQCKMQYALNQTAREISGYYYVVDKTGITSKLGKYKKDLENDETLNGANAVVHDINDLINNSNDVITNVLNLSDSVQNTTDEVVGNVISGDFVEATNVAVNGSEQITEQTYNIVNQTSDLVDQADNICTEIESLVTDPQNLKKMIVNVVKVFTLSFVEAKVNDLITSKVCPALMKRYLTDGDIDSFYNSVGIVQNSISFCGSELMTDGRSVKLVLSYKMNLGKLSFGMVNKEIAFTHVAATAAWVHPCEDYVLSLPDLSKVLNGQELPHQNHLPDVTAAPENDENTESEEDPEEPAESEEPAETVAVVEESVHVLTTEEKEYYKKYNKENFKPEGTFEEDYPKKIGMTTDEMDKIVNCNFMSTCGYDSNINKIAGKVQYETNDKFTKKLDSSTLDELNKMRSNVPAVTEDTIMQKVITPSDYKAFIEGREAKIGGCVSRASDVAPYTRTPKDTYEALRLDYPGTTYSETDSSMYVVRFTSDYTPSNNDIPRVGEYGNVPPCTGTGFTGSKNHLIPEYYYGKYNDEKNGLKTITSGAIYRVDDKGDEKIVAILEGNKFIPVIEEEG